MVALAHSRELARKHILDTCGCGARKPRRQAVYHTMSRLSKFKVTLQNYRSIPPGNPLELALGGGVVFILGRNNAGKSNLLRFFNELRHLWDRCAMANLAQLESVFDLRLDEDLKWDSMANRDGLALPIRLSVSCEEAVVHFEIVSTREAHSNEIQIRYRKEGLRETDYEGFRAIFMALRDCIYIPSSRSIRHAPSRRQNVVTGEQFVHSWKQWSAGARVGHRSAVDLLQEELRILFGYSRLHIQPNALDKDLVVRTDTGTFELSELGDGFSHFLIVLANAAIFRPALIFIDEPENGLHPKLQVAFVQTLARYASLGLVATSHSVGLARSIADEIFFLSRSNGQVRLRRFGAGVAGSLSGEAYEMGYSQFVELGGAGLLLVEGRTDIKAYREILRHLQLDQSFIVISLGGGEFFTSNESHIVHELEDLKRLNPAVVSVIYDGGRTKSDSSYDPRCKVFHTVCERLGFKVHPTERLEIENYVSQSALDVVFGVGKMRHLGEYEKMGKSGSWDKSKNWQLFAAMTRDEIMATDIAKFIQEKLKPLVIGLPTSE